MTLLIFLESMLVVGTGVILTMLFWAVILPVIANLEAPRPSPPQLHWNGTTMVINSAIAVEK